MEVWGQALTAAVRYLLDALANGPLLTGAGTAGMLPKWSAGNQLTNSILHESGLNIELSTGGSIVLMATNQGLLFANDTSSITGSPTAVNIHVGATHCAHFNATFTQF